MGMNRSGSGAFGSLITDGMSANTLATKNCQYKFQKRGQLFIGTDDEPIPVVPTPTSFAEKG
jgi:hypothetical protein